MELLQSYIEQIKQFHQAGGTGALATLNQQALAQLAKLELPKPKDENWLYTAIQKHLPTQLMLSSSEAKLHHAEETLHKLLPKDCDYLVLKNGRVLSDWQKLPSTIEVQALPLDAQNLEALSGQADPSFATLNLATVAAAYKIRFKAQHQSKTPLVIVHLFEVQTKLNYQAPLLWIETQTGAEACVAECFSSIDQHNTQAGDTNALTFIKVAAASKLEHVKVQWENENHIHIGQVKATVERDANFQSFSFSLGAKVCRNNIQVELKAPGAHVRVDGLYALKADQHCDNYVIVDHQAGHTQSEQLFKGILNDQSRGVFTGKVEIAKSAQQVNAAQLNKNLLLSKKAQANTRPQLVVHADDVKCAHGATVGQMNPEEVFYLESRGIPHNIAQQMLWHGFATDAFEKISCTTLRPWLEQLLNQNYEAQAFAQLEQNE